MKLGVSVDTKEMVDLVYYTLPYEHSRTVTKENVREILNAYGEVVANCLAEGRPVKIHNVGVFRFRKVADRYAPTNPFLGDFTMKKVPPFSKLVFRVSAPLQNLIKEKTRNNPFE